MNLTYWFNLLVLMPDDLFKLLFEVAFIKRSSLEDFLLEPITEDGEIMSVAEAMKCSL
jgi:hypothetical protein